MQFQNASPNSVFLSQPLAQRLLLLTFVASTSLSALAQDEAPTPVLIAIGGFRSCDGEQGRDRVRLKFDPAIAAYQAELKIKYAVEPIVMRACFQNKVGLGSAYYYDGWDNKVWDLRTSDFFEDQSEARSAYHVIGQAIASSARARARAVKNPVYFVIGHSIGAWLAYQVADSMISKSAKVGSLLTIDAISGVECSPRDYLMSLGIPAVGCNFPPNEWNNSAARKLDEDIGGHWYNFYERQFFFLHSDAIPALPKNRNFEMFYEGGGEHMQIDDDQRIWKFFARRTGALIQDQP